VVWAVSLSTPDLCTRGLTTGRRIRRFRGLGNGFIHPSLPKSPLPQRWFLTTIRCTTKIVFVENQLSPGSVSFSLLPAAHPMLVQQQRVRSPTLGKFSRRNCTGGGFRASPAHPLSGEVHGHRGLTLGPEGSEEPPGPSPRPPRRRIASLAGQRRIGTTPYTAGRLRLFAIRHLGRRVGYYPLHRRGGSGYSSPASGMPALTVQSKVAAVAFRGATPSATPKGTSG